MIIGTINSGSYTAGSDIPITLYQDTNNVYSLSNNKVAVHKPGITDVKANIVVTSTGTDTLIAQLYADSNPISNIIASFTPAASTNYTFSINCPLLVQPKYFKDDVELSLRLNKDCTLVGGYVSMEYRP